MKKLLLSLATVIFFFTNANAQLIADAGNDDTICYGITITLGGSPSAVGGTPPYTYSWTSNPPTLTGNGANPIISPMFTGSYFLIVTDNVGAQAFDTVTITVLVNPEILFNVSDTNGCSPGIFNFTSSPAMGTPPYSYSWNFNDGGSSNIRNPSHTYTSIGFFIPSVVVTDANGCTDTVSGMDISPQQNIHITTNCNGFNITHQNATCFNSCNGSATVTPAGNYRYLWSSTDTTASVTNLCAGAYSVTVMDSVLTPLDTLSVTITQPAQMISMSSSTPVSCFGGNDGSIVVTTTGGTPPYMYLWSNGSIGTNQFNLPAGTYTATVVDNNNCTTAVTATITQPTPMVLTATVTNASGCGVCDGAATLNVSGGTLPVTYWWSNGVTTPTTTNLCPGVYIGYVTNANGCTDTAIAIVNATGSALNVTTSVGGHVTCTNPNGSITALVSGGTPPYAYVWNTGDSTATVSNLTFGLYTVSVTDSSGCSGFAVDTVFNQQSFMYHVYVTASAANCASNGSANATVYGGAPPYTYIWNTTPPQTTPTATGLSGGIQYSVTVTDSLGCQRTGSTYIYTSCRNLITGRLIRDLNGNCVIDSGDVPFAYQTIIADGGGGTSYSSTDAQGYYTISVLAGTYTVRLYRSSVCLVNCSGVDTSYTITFPGVGDTVNNVNFYLTPAPFNLYVTNGWAGFRPGFNATVYLYYGNSGMDTVDGTITYTYDSDLTYVSASNGGVHNATNRTITWAIADIVPQTYYYYYYGSYFVTATFLTPIGTPMNTAIVNHSRITGPGTECDSSDNVYTTTTFVTNSYDPNDKRVMPEGDIYDQTDSVLTYTIRFQNTGTDTAWFVILKDTLSAYLNAASVQNIASSHPITEFKVEGEGILTWVFNPIYLVDSFTNEPASHGYVTFRVKKKSGLAIGTEIKNTAHIYFDYNEPVVTNTVTSRIADPNFIFTVRGDENISVAAMPNPFTQQTQVVVEGVKGSFDFELFDVAGKLMKKISALVENRFELNRDDMSAGVYFYRLTTTTMQRAYGKLVVE